MIVQNLPRIGLMLGLIVLLTACAAPAAPIATPPPTAATAPTILPMAPPSPTPAPSPTAAPPPTAAPSPSPAPPPTVTEAPRATATAAPTAPERPAGMTVFAGFTAAYEGGKWAQKDKNGQTVFVWGQEEGRWVISEGVKSLEIGPGGVHEGAVVAKSAAEIKALMDKTSGKFPLPIGVPAGKITIQEVIDAGNMLVFDGVGGTPICAPVLSDYKAGGNTTGGNSFHSLRIASAKYSGALMFGAGVSVVGGSSIQMGSVLFRATSEVVRARGSASGHQLAFTLRVDNIQ